MLATTIKSVPFLAGIVLLLAVGLSCDPFYAVDVLNDTGEVAIARDKGWQTTIAPGKLAKMPARDVYETEAIYHLTDSSGGLIGCLVLHLSGLKNTSVRVTTKVSQAVPCPD